MKKVGMFVVCLGFALPMMISCAGGPAYTGARAASSDAEMTFNDVTGKEWVLTEIRSARSLILIDRAKLEASNMGGFFTLSFQEGRVGGTGAPNRYFGPYTAGSGRALSFGNIASTMMAAFLEPEELKEYEYFAYLSKVTGWNLRGGKLELNSSNANGAEAVLVFTQK